MVTVTVDEDTLLEMLLDRLEFWTSDEDVINLYRDYYERLVYSGGFEGCTLDIMIIVDNDYINNLTTISKEDFEQWGIESIEDDKIVAFNEEESIDEEVDCDSKDEANTTNRKTIQRINVYICIRKRRDRLYYNSSFFWATVLIQA